MADKDEFKFDDDDTFPETDLSGAFSEGEQSAPDQPEYPMTIKKAGGSRSRVLLLLLLLVVIGAGAAYYFLMMEEPVPPPAPPAKKVVAAVPKPAPVPVSPPPATPAPAAAPVPAPARPATVAVPPPKPEAVPAPTKPAVAVVPTPAKTEVKPAAAPAKTEAEVKPVSAAKLVATSGPWLIEAGTYVNPAELKVAGQKIRKLGYEPQTSTMQKTVRMTRLRVGSYPESEAREALAYARGIAPDAFALRAGGTTTIYAGTFANQANLRQMAERFSSEGVSVAEEPVEVKRTITLLRFGGFPDQAAANEVAAKARREGVVAEVIKGK